MIPAALPAPVRTAVPLPCGREHLDPENPMKRFALSPAAALPLVFGFGAWAGTGDRVEFSNRVGTPSESRGKIHRFIDVRRLTEDL